MKNRCFRLAMGERQKRLLKLLRGSKPELSVDELSKGLETVCDAAAPFLAGSSGIGVGRRYTRRGEKR